MRAPWRTDWPTPPQPITVTVAPGFTAAVLSAAPTPVVTPHPMSASCSAGRSVSTFTSIDSSTVISSANVPRPLMPMTLAPSVTVTLADHRVRAHLLAQLRLVAQAEEAVAAGGDERGDDGVALRHPGDLGADRQHRARALVPEDRRGREREAAVRHAQVRVADATGVDVHEDVARARSARR